MLPSLLLAGAVRIVTLVPSLTDDLIAMGAQRALVGVSSYTRALQVSGLPRVADFQSVDAERIAELRPTAVVGIPLQAEAVQPLLRMGLRVVLMQDDGFADIFSDIQTLGTLAKCEPAARRLISRLHAETSELRASVAASSKHPSVFFVLGVDPVWTAGPSSFVGHLIELAGGRDAASDLSAPWGEYSEEALLRAQPDVIVAGPHAQLQNVLMREPWRSLRAVRKGRVLITDSRIDDALTHPSANYNEGLRWLIERLSR